MKTDKILSIAILLLAFALRMVALDQWPTGLSHDEAYNGVAAMQVLQGERPIFLEINKGIEPLIIYLEALAFSAFGIGVVQMRLVNVLCGMVTVALVYPLTKRLFTPHESGGEKKGGNIALLAMSGVAVSFWAVFVSRLTLRAVTLPPLLLLTLYFFWRGTVEQASCLSKQNRQDACPTNFIISGLAAGVAMYTYLSSRFIPFILIFGFGFWILDHHSIQNRKSKILNQVILFLIWATLFAPLAYYFLTHPDSFSRRANQVLTVPPALEGDFAPLLKSTYRTLAMFTLAGDRTDRYNLDGRPVFDAFNGLFFYLGLGLTLVSLFHSKYRWRSFFLLTWLFFMLLPGFITGDSPHFLRTIGVMPLAYIFWAIGLAWTMERTWLKPWHSSYFLLLTAYCLLLTLTSYDYFYRWANSPGARQIYGADIAEIATYLRQHPAKDLTVISAPYYRDLDLFRYTLHWQGHPPFAIWFDGQQTLAFPPPSLKLSPRYLFAASAPPSELWLKFLRPAESGQDYMLYRLPQDFSVSQIQLTKTLNININNDVQLLGYQISGKIVKKGKIQVLLAWQALRTLPPGTDYTFLVRLHDQQGHIWAEADGLGYSPADWQTGVYGLQLLTLRLPSDLPSFENESTSLTVQLVQRQTGQALPATTGETAIILGIGN